MLKKGCGRRTPSFTMRTAPNWQAMKRRCELSGAHSISVILVTPGMAMVDTANPEGTSAECSLKAIPHTPKRLSILPGIIILTVLKQNLQTGATSIGLTAANRWDEAGVVGCEYH